MKQIRFFLSICLGLFALISKAESKTYDGLFVIVNGCETVYQLSETPTVTYAENKGVKIAVLKLKGADTPIASVELKNGATLQLIYGTYNPSSINSVKTDIIITEKHGKMFITGGKLIIIAKDGKQYNSNGTRIK